MKKIILLILLSSMLLSTLAGCNGKEQLTDEEISESEIVTEAQSEEIPADFALSQGLAEKLRNEMPITDGSTSAIPLDAAVRAGIFNITAEEAEKSVVHTTSHDSYYNLLDRKCDFVFCHLLSQEQYEQASQRGISVELSPIAREGFVFLVSIDNPIESLTVEQVKKIYSGEITNWKDVGGEDKPIVAYQRNIDSGSQNYMRVFMGSTPLADAPTELRPANMNTLVDAVASYNGEAGSIGYSVYSYVGGMYDADGMVKIIKIDGVEPTFATISDGTYPCTGYNYAVIRSDEAENSPARNLLAWILTSAGQKAIAQTGYFAPLNPTKNIDVSIKDLNLMTDVGTGSETYEKTMWCYTASFPTKQYVVNTDDEPYSIQKNNRIFYTDNIAYPVTGNKTLDDEIYDFVQNTVNDFTDLEFDSDIPLYSDNINIWLGSSYAAVNGYLSVYLTRGNGYTKSAVWDIESGKRLKLSDLFSKGTAFVPSVNSAIKKRIDYNGTYGVSELDTINVFEGIEAGFDNFGISVGYSEMLEEFNCVNIVLYFNVGDNRYFAENVNVEVLPYDTEGCLLAQRRDMSGLNILSQKKLYFIRDCTEYKAQDIQKEDVGKYCWSGQKRMQIVKGYPGADKINAEMQKYLDSFEIEYLREIVWSDETQKKVLEYYARIIEDMANYGGPGIDKIFDEEYYKFAYLLVKTDTQFFGNKYVAVNYAAYAQYLDSIGFGDTGVYFDRTVKVYDLETGDEVGFDKIISDYQGEAIEKIAVSDGRNYIWFD